jgi:hypothetical protein
MKELGIKMKHTVRKRLEVTFRSHKKIYVGIKGDLELVVAIVNCGTPNSSVIEALKDAYPDYEITDISITSKLLIEEVQ